MATVASLPDHVRSVAERSSARPQPRTRLRVGLFADSALQPRWMVETFERIAVSAFAEIAVIAVCDGEHPAPPWLWQAYARADRKILGSQPDPLEQIELLARVPHARLIQSPRHDRSTAAEWRSELATLNLHVAFALGDVEDWLLAGIAQYGVWRYTFGAGGARATLSGFREFVGGETVTASGITVRTDLDRPARIAYQSWSRTRPLSLARGHDRILRKTAEFAGRALRELHRTGDRWLESCAPIVGAAPLPAPAMPATGEIVRGVSRIGARIARRALQKLLYVDQWFLACQFGGTRNERLDLRHFMRIMPPKDRFWADPFPIERDGRYYIFFEELEFGSGKGHIAVMEVHPSGRHSEPVRVLERDYHLSYPFLIEEDGALYMVPETRDNRTVELYRCVAFPDRWRLEKVLLQNVHCVDATLHRSDTGWWMFANAGIDENDDEMDDELHLFHSDHLRGEWQPHPANPVKSDVRCARPAGGLYCDSGALYRPGQICAPLYGSGISINQVVQLTPQTYVERQVQRIVPASGSDVLGIHTLNRAGAMTVMDAFTRRWRI